MRVRRILWSLALTGLGVGLGIGFGLPGSSASVHHAHRATWHHVHGVVVQPAYLRQAYYWQNGVRPPLRALGGYCPPPRIIPRNRDSENARYVDDGEYCD